MTKLIEILSNYSELIILSAGFVVIAISANQIAKVFQKANLPLITGLIVTGIFAGPYVLNLVPLESQSRLTYINEIALAFIAFAAGSELYLKELRGQLNSIKWNTFGQLTITFIVSTGFLWFFSDSIPFLAGQPTKIILAISTLMATVFIARSPASAIAVINELRAKGPFTQTALGVTVVKDFLVIVLFSICLSFAQSIISDKPFSLIQLLFLFGEMALSFFIGFYIIGNLLKLVLKWHINKRTKAILVLAVGYGAYYGSNAMASYSSENLVHTILLEPLLMCILASFNVTNYSKNRAEFLVILRNVEIYIYVAFFTLTGASLNILVFGSVVGVAFLLFAIRLVGMIIGAYVGGILAKDPIKHIHLGWMPYITQAGVALGLSTVVSSQFPEWGDYFSTAVIALIVINQFIGPPIFKWAIFQVGEARIRGIGDPNTARTVTIFGFEPQSVALAHQLAEKNWVVELATLKRKGSFDEPEDVKIRYLRGLDKEELDLIKLNKVEVIVTMLSDSENLQICETAYNSYGTRDMVVRLNHRFNSKAFLALGAKIIDPSTAIVSLMDHFVRSPQATSLLLGMEENQDSRDIEILNPNLHGIYLRDLRLPSDVIILSVIRAGQSIITHGYTRLRVNDTVTVVGTNESLDQVQFKFDR